MKIKLLKLKQDLAFKIFFSRPENEGLLISFLTAILKPKRAIVSVKVLNPIIPQDTITDKTIILDLLVEFDDGTKVNIEMQAQNLHNTRPRSLFYWARLHQSQLAKGENYNVIQPTKMIFILNFDELEDTTSFHNVVQTFSYPKLPIQENPKLTKYSDDLEIHIIELTKLEGFLKGHENMVNRPEVLWSKFLNAETEEEIEEVLKMDSTTFTPAYEALRVISSDNEIAQMVNMREMAYVNYITSMHGAEQKGIAIGEARGEARGKEIGKIAQFIEIKYGISENITEERLSSVKSLEELSFLLKTLKESSLNLEKVQELISNF